MENIIINFEKFLRKQKKLPFLLESFLILTYKGKSGNKLIQYITASAIFLIFLILGLVIGLCFFCPTITTSLSSFNLLSFLFLILTPLISNLIISPLWLGFNLMVYKDVFSNSKSDLSDLFFFLHSLNKTKRVLLLHGYIISLLSTAVIWISIVIIFLIFSNMNNWFLAFFKIPLIAAIVILIAKILFLILILTISLSIIFIPLLFFISKNKDNFQESPTIEKEIQTDINEIFKGKEITDILLKSTKVYFSNLSSFLISSFILSIGVISLFGIVFVFPWCSIMNAVIIKKYIS